MKNSDLKALRALSNEVAPKETPVIFSQAFFLRRYAGSGVTKDPVAKQLIENLKSYTIPYAYQARLADDKFRDLHLIHPSSQVASARFLQKHGPALSERCQGSSFSVRYPSRVRPWRKFWSKSPAGGPRQLVLSQFPPFFLNKRFLRLYKFLESDEFIELERRFSLMMELDIRKCFYSIYTHSVTWAITEKHYAKSSFKRTPYESELDKIFQRMNFNETNGIVVGPEFSRVFAEIVLQDVDVRLEEELVRSGMKKERDYAIRRYVDNYYIFSRRQDVIIQIRKSIERHLKEYKLYLNDEKTVQYARPFMNCRGRLGQSISELINSFFKDLVTTESESEFLRPTIEALAAEPTPLVRDNISEHLPEDSQLYQLRLARDRRISAKEFIRKYRKLVADYEFETGANASQVLGSIRRLLIRVEERYVSHLGRADQAYAEQTFARDIGAVIQYFCSSNPSFTSVDYGIDCLIRARSICGAGSNLNEEFAESLWRLFCDVFYVDRGGVGSASAMPLEFSCFLSVLPTFEIDPLISEEELLDVWLSVEHKRDDFRSFPYWEAMSLLFYANRGKKYRKIKSKVLRAFRTSLKNPRSEIRADVSLGILDLVRYPGFSRQCRSSLYRLICRRLGVSSLNQEVEAIIGSDEPWFIDWNQNFDLRSRLDARRLQSAY